MPVLVAVLQIAPLGLPAASRAAPLRSMAGARIARVQVDFREPGVICETRQVPRRVVRRIFVLDTVTRCSTPGGGALERLEQLCRIDVLAYGPDAGRERCRARVEASPELRAP